jgi:enoyl-CoA hydratase
VPGARFFYPVMKLGFLPQPSDPGAPGRAGRPGTGQDDPDGMGGQRIDAPEALSWGLIDRIVPVDALTRQPGRWPPMSLPPSPAMPPRSRR